MPAPSCKPGKECQLDENGRGSADHRAEFEAELPGNHTPPLDVANDHVDQAGTGRIAGLPGQVTTLREQVEQLLQHVNDLAADYSQLAKDYGRIANALATLLKR